jgi:hypothetical protein
MSSVTSRSGNTDAATLFSNTRRLHVPRINPMHPIVNQNNPQQALKPSPPANTPVPNSIHG